MRLLLISLITLLAGIALGAAVPGLSSMPHQALVAMGLARPTPSAAAPAKADSHDEGGEHTSGQAHKAEEGEHGEHAEEGVIRMQPDQLAAQDITVTRVGGGTLARHLLVPGTVTMDADRVARVPARVVGTVAEMRKRLGDPVEKGEMVAVLDSREIADAKSEYLTAQVQAELQKTNFERQQKLLTSSATSVLSYDQARASYLDTQLRMDLARQKLSALGLNAAEVEAATKRDEGNPGRSSLRLYPVRAPLSGRVVERKVDVGTKVGSEGDPSDLYTVADLSSVWIELAVATTELAGVREGARVAVATSADKAAARSEGKVVFVSPLLNADTRSARVIVSLPNPDNRWRPGTFVSAEIEIAQDAVAVLVPRKVVQMIEGKPVVFVRTAAGFARREVTLGRADDDAFEVVAGLNAGEEIADANTFLLKAELGKSDADHDH